MAPSSSLFVSFEELGLIVLKFRLFSSLQRGQAFQYRLICEELELINCVSLILILTRPVHNIDYRASMLTQKD